MTKNKKSYNTSVQKKNYRYKQGKEKKKKKKRRMNNSKVKKYTKKGMPSEILFFFGFWLFSCLELNSLKKSRYIVAFFV
jgi:hypothetical protein